MCMKVLFILNLRFLTSKVLKSIDIVFNFYQSFEKVESEGRNLWGTSTHLHLLQIYNSFSKPMVWKHSIIIHFKFATSILFIEDENQGVPNIRVHIYFIYYIGIQTSCMDAKFITLTHLLKNLEIYQKPVECMKSFTKKISISFKN